MCHVRPSRNDLRLYSMFKISNKFTLKTHLQWPTDQVNNRLLKLLQIMSFMITNVQSETHWNGVNKNKKTDNYGGELSVDVCDWLLCGQADFLCLSAGTRDAYGDCIYNYTTTIITTATLLLLVLLHGLTNKHYFYNHISKASDKIWVQIWVMKQESLEMLPEDWSSSNVRWNHTTTRPATWALAVID